MQKGDYVNFNWDHCCGQKWQWPDNWWQLDFPTFSNIQTYEHDYCWLPWAALYILNLVWKSHRDLIFKWNKENKEKERNITRTVWKLWLPGDCEMNWGWIAMIQAIVIYVCTGNMSHVTQDQILGLMERHTNHTLKWRKQLINHCKIQTTTEKQTITPQINEKWAKGKIKFT